MEEEIEPYQIDQAFWTSTKLGSPDSYDLDFIAQALVSAEAPLVITGYTGRDPDGTRTLVELGDTVPGLRVLDTAGTAMCFPADHPAWLGLRYGEDESIAKADVLIVLECDVHRSATGTTSLDLADNFHRCPGLHQDVVRAKMHSLSTSIRIH